jgi:hypothetical protein
MSVEVHVLFDRSRLPTRDEWQRQLDEAVLGVRLDSGFEPQQAAGFQPMTFKERSTGCEFYLDRSIGTLARRLLRSTWTAAGRLLVFAGAADLDEMAAGLAAAASLAVLTDGIYLDPQDDTILDGQGAIAMALSELANL